MKPAIADAIRRETLCSRPDKTTFPHCFQCDHSYSRTTADNSRFCSQRCQDAFDRDVPRYEAKPRHAWRDGRPMQAGAGGFHTNCAGCGKDFVSKGLRCCSTECERTLKEKREIAELTAGIEPIHPRKTCKGCGDRIPRFKDGKAVRKDAKYCSPKCAQKAWREGLCQNAVL